MNRARGTLWGERAPSGERGTVHASPFRDTCVSRRGGTLANGTRDGTRRVSSRRVSLLACMDCLSENFGAGISWPVFLPCLHQLRVQKSGVAGVPPLVAEPCVSPDFFPALPSLADIQNRPVRLAVPFRLLLLTWCAPPLQQRYVNAVVGHPQGE